MDVITRFFKRLLAQLVSKFQVKKQPETLQEALKEGVAKITFKKVNGI